MDTTERPLGTKNREALLALLLEGYESNPDAVAKALPFVSQRLGVLMGPRARTSPPAHLTERERAHRLESLTKAVAKTANGRDREACIAALENAAALLGDRLAQDAVPRERLLQLAQHLTGASLAQKARASTVPVRGGEMARSVPLVRGVVLNLTWDGRLVSISFDSQEHRRRLRALAFVGTGVETQNDVAEQHDHYLADLGPSG